jgi:hypothetical protein
LLDGVAEVAVAGEAVGDDKFALAGAAGTGALPAQHWTPFGDAKLVMSSPISPATLAARRSPRPGKLR